MTQRHKTQVGCKIGTPAFLPPEAGLCDAEPRLDVYSVGVSLYQLCTQRLPGEEFQPIPDAPADLSRLLRAAIEPDVDDRLPTADHLRRGLEAILAVHPRTPEPTHLLGGCYDRLELIGVGANAAVFRGSDRELEREVAIKVLRQAEPSEDAVIRFRRAAKILSVVRHSNIPQIHHFGVDHGQRFAVTELCPGSPAPFVPMSDAQWKTIAAIVESTRGRSGPRTDLRRTVDGIRWVLHTGPKWSEIPVEHGRATTAWRWYERWCGDGTWQQIAATLELPPAEVGREPGRRPPRGKSRKSVAPIDVEAVEAAPM